MLYRNKQNKDFIVYNWHGYQKYDGTFCGIVLKNSYVDNYVYQVNDLLIKDFEKLPKGEKVIFQNSQYSRRIVRAKSNGIIAIISNIKNNFFDGAVIHSHVPTRICIAGLGELSGWELLPDNFQVVLENEH